MIGVVDLAVRALLLPVTHLLLPVFRLCYFFFRHLVLIPIGLLLRGLLYGVVYLPLSPVLFVAQIRLDNHLTIESSLLNLICNLWPHIRMLVNHCTHYFMVSFYVGTLVGVLAGFNMCVISWLFRLPLEITDKSRDEIKGESSQKQHILPQKHGLVVNEPKIKLEALDSHYEEIRPAPLLDGPVYEDDDGYSYMALASPDDTTITNRSSGPARRRKSASLITNETIKEEPDSELLPAPQQATHTSPTNDLTIDNITGTIGSTSFHGPGDTLFSWQDSSTDRDTHSDAPPSKGSFLDSKPTSRDEGSPGKYANHNHRFEEIFAKYKP